ncbi:Chitinase domain-containing protein 1 [Phlyctochytrium planicorne]|nr:Chitinase domain-containing protein 1 [Phlyctochytrium planicorne]
MTLLMMPSAKADLIIGTTPDTMNVFDRDLVVKNPSARSIVQNHAIYSKPTAHIKESKESTLVYVTPWNNKGYDIVKTFRGKFTYVSPVWYTVKPGAKEDDPYILEGGHDVDKGWMDDVRKPVGEFRARVVPRFQLANMDKEKVKQMATGEQGVTARIIDAVIKECIVQGFDGFVFEFHLVAFVPIFVETLAKRARNANLVLFLVIPPHRDTENGPQVLFDRSHFERYKDIVTGFSLMTYDYSNPRNPGPNAPLEWVESNVLALCPEYEDRNKIFVGLNFYGADYRIKGGGGPIVGTQYLDLLSKFSPLIEYDADVNEHKFYYEDPHGEQHVVWYPTLQSLDERLLSIDEMGTSISIWEVGQGLDYFYDLI